MTDTSAPIVTADGTPLKKKLDQAMFRSRRNAFLLVAPLLAFIIASFIIPIVVLLTQGVYDSSFRKQMPTVATFVADWDGQGEPSEEMMQAALTDIVVGLTIDRSIPTKAAVRINREVSGATSMIKKLIRATGKWKIEYEGKEQRLSDVFRNMEDEDDSGVTLLDESERRAIGVTLAKAVIAQEAPVKAKMIKADKKWADIKYWQAMKVASKAASPAYLAAALDYNYSHDGEFQQRDEDRRIHVKLFWRTLEISLIVTLACLFLGYPIAYLLSTLSVRSSNLLLILVLLPFWTSLLVRTTAWIAMLQAQGVMNDLFVVFGLAADDDRFSLIYNKTGTLIAMTHILLPFMILPLYSVMKTIPPSYVRAAKSMGATNWTAFWRVYFPQSVAGIGAGALLVFILAIGYYITPALVGGQDGQMISNMIDFHMRKSLNWNLAAALGMVLLVFVLFLFWIYDRVVGIDNMKLG